MCEGLVWKGSVSKYEWNQAQVSGANVPVMLIVEHHAFLEEVQLGFVWWAVAVVGFSTHLLTHCRFLKLKLTHKWPRVSQEPNTFRSRREDFKVWTCNPFPTASERKGKELLSVQPCFQTAGKWSGHARLEGINSSILLYLRLRLNEGRSRKQDHNPWALCSPQTPLFQKISGTNFSVAERQERESKTKKESTKLRKSSTPRANDFWLESIYK